MSVAHRLERAVRERLYPLRVRLLGPERIRLSPVVPAPLITTERTVLGARLTPDLPAFRVSGFRIGAVAELPYSRQGLDYTRGDVVLDLEDDEYPTDDGGVAIVRDLNGRSVYNPVSIGQYGLAALGGFDRTGKTEYLQSALANANKLLAMSSMVDDARWFPYDYEHVYLDVTVHAPWYSAMAQGQAVSLFVRLAQIDVGAEAEWMRAADEVLGSLLVHYRDRTPWACLVDENEFLWFEEFAGDAPPLRVFNGHGYALFGLYDYFRHTGSEVARQLFDGGATTLLYNFPLFRVPGGPSYYFARPDYCRRPEWQNHIYHPLHIQQLSWLAEMTGDPRFATAAAELESDFEFTP